MTSKVSIPQATDIAEIDFRQLVSNCIEGVSSFPGAQEMVLETSVNKSSNFYSYPQLIAVMINSLLINAFKLRRQEVEPSVKIGVAYDNYKAVLTISDNGRGINQNEIGKFFDLSNPAIQHDDLVGGINLYMVNEIVKKLGGKISVESAENKGTEFNIEIPNQIHLQNVLEPQVKRTNKLNHFY